MKFSYHTLMVFFLATTAVLAMDEREFKPQGNHPQQLNITPPNLDIEINEHNSNLLNQQHDLNILPDDIAITREENGHTIFGFYRGTMRISEVMLPNITRNPQIVWTPGSTLYVQGKDQNGETAVVEVKNDGTTKTLQLGLNNIHFITPNQDGTVYVRGRDQNGKYIIVEVMNDGTTKILQPELNNIISINIISIIPSQDGTTYVQGRCQNNKDAIIEVKNDGTIKTLQLELKKIDSIIPSQGGTLYVRGMNQNNKDAITEVKNDGTIKTMELGLKLVDSITPSNQDGTVYVQGRDQNAETTIVEVKSDGTTKTLQLGLNKIYSIIPSQGGTLYVRGKSQNGEAAIVEVKSDGTAKTLQLELDNIFSILPSQDGTIYVRGMDQNGKDAIVIIKDGKVEGSVPYGDEARMTKVKGILSSLTHNLKSSKAFANNQINITEFEKLCHTIIDIRPEVIYQQAGIAFYDYFHNHLVSILNNTEAADILYHLLNELINEKNNHPLTPYAAALLVDIYLGDPNYPVIRNSQKFNPLNLKQVMETIGEDAYEEKLNNTKMVLNLITIINDSKIPQGIKDKFKSDEETMKTALQQLLHVNIPDADIPGN